jgi:hypothetical protein
MLDRTANASTAATEARRPGLRTLVLVVALANVCAGRV